MSIIKSSAVIFTPGKTKAAAIDPAAIPAAAATPRHALAWTTDIKIRPVDQDTIQWDAGSVKFSDNASQSVSTTGSPKTLSPASNNGVWYVYKQFTSSTLLFTQNFSTAIGSDRIQLGIIVVTADTNGMATVLVKGDTGGPHISAQSIAVNVLSALTANLGEVTAGTITGVLIRTSASGQRVQMSSADSLDFFDSSGVKVGDLDVSGYDVNTVQHLLLRAFGSTRDLSLVSARGIALYPVDAVSTPGDFAAGVVVIDGNLFVNQVTRLNNVLQLHGNNIERAGDLSLDSLTKDGSGPIQVNSNTDFTRLVQLGASTELLFEGHQVTDIGTDTNRAANIWASGAILNALALRENQTLAAQAGRSVLFVSGSGASAQLKIIHSNGTTHNIPAQSTGLVTPSVTLQADDASIASGGSVVLTWTSAMAVSVVINQGVGTVTPTAGGTKTVTPTSTRTYTITATSSTGHTATASVRITVGSTPPVVGNRPVINSFTRSSGSIVSGSSVTLDWSTSGATSVSINQGIGTVSSSGTRTVTPTVTTTYTLTATNSNGSRTSTVTVTVTPVSTAAPTIDSFDVQPRTGSVGDSVTISWATTGATSVQIQRRAIAFAPYWSFLATDTPDGSRSTTLLRDPHYQQYATWRYRLRAIGTSTVNSSAITVSES